MPPKKGSKAYQKAERERKRHAREQESEEAKEKRLEQQKQYDSEKKLQMAQEQREESSEQKRLHEASRRQKMSSEDTEDLQKKDRSRKKLSRESMSPEHKAESQEQARSRMASHRQSMSPEDKAETQKQDRLRKKSSRLSMSQDDKAELQKKEQRRKTSFRRSMSPEHKADSQKQDRSRKKSSRQSMSPEDKQEVKSQNRLHKETLRHSLNPTEKEIQRERDRESHATKRKVDKQKIITIEEAAENFKRKCYDLPEYICTCCHRLLWKQSVHPFKIEKYDMTNDVVKRCFSPDILKETKPGEMYICTTCNGDLKKKHPIMPAQAVANGLELDPTPPPGLQKPNQMEIMMFRREIPFMKMGSLPRGRQYRMQGPVVNVPSKLETVCQLLPRLPNEAMLVPIKLKRRLCYKGHYLYDDIRPHVVMEWLKWLKENNRHYADVNISFDWCNLMTQFQDNGNCIYPSLNTKMQKQKTNFDYTKITSGDIIYTYGSCIISVSHDVFSESTDTSEERPDQTSESDTKDDKSGTQMSSEAQKSDTNPSEQSTCQSTKGKSSNSIIDSPNFKHIAVDLNFPIMHLDFISQ